MITYWFRWETDKDFLDNLERLKQVPQQLEDIQILLETGCEEGITYAKESLDRTKAQFERLQVLLRKIA